MPKNTPMRRKDRKVTDEDAIRFILMKKTRAASPHTTSPSSEAGVCP